MTTTLRQVLRDPPSLAFAVAQPVAFAVLFRHLPGGITWSGTLLVVLASTYFRLRLAGPQPERRPSP